MSAAGIYVGAIIGTFSTAGIGNYFLPHPPVIFALSILIGAGWIGACLGHILDR